MTNDKSPESSKNKLLFERLRHETWLIIFLYPVRFLCFFITLGILLITFRASVADLHALVCLWVNLSVLSLALRLSAFILFSGRGEEQPDD